MAAKKRSKKKTGATRHPEQSSSSWAWLFMGLIVACFVTFLVYLDNIPTEGEQSISKQSEKKQAIQKKKQQQKSKPKPKHQFDFYTVLPDREVKASTAGNTKREKPPSSKKPKTEVKSAPRVVQKQSSNKPGVSALYQLQVGAFKELPKADAMKARLALNGVESNIQVIQSKGQKLYRVRVGPSTDEQHIQDIKKQLKAQNINTFMQKLSG